ncbi:hypothetical protein M441DRAFT_309851 [Trichoderma asperellum CBS 433.97]|uniref:Uncharacterized protein n=1 Tax=Trichoderma asperellum (strain ATCC 204424 / CBS 433.97 / NBRC 101777) TaxID=1042311 RepID=A0A2T3ZK79_TRIA4|nr:hypothetical protein M441DRAFT_309851 [Trichoderma asperellum CBS 433.97]PTB45206.1 hypothetical protein M441DRAFT_309851 [Trichoderma asperellum CBS 433.97]
MGSLASGEWWCISRRDRHIILRGCLRDHQCARRVSTDCPWDCKCTFSGPWIVGVLASPARPQRRKSIYSLALRRPPPSILFFLFPLSLSLCLSFSVTLPSCLVVLTPCSFAILGLACFRRRRLLPSTRACCVTGRAVDTILPSQA